MRQEIYLDNAATSWPKPEGVYQAVCDYMRCNGSSSGRGAYRRALQADAMVFQTRKALARLFHLPHPSRLVFTANATEALNLALKGLLRPGSHVVTTTMEHNAVWRCLKGLELTRGIRISIVPCSREGRLDWRQVEAAFTPETHLIVMTHASNVTGTVMPVAEVGAVARRRGIPLLVDAAQTAGAYPINLEEQKIDLLAFTGHKALLGPQGTGGLYIGEGIDLVPLKEGGTGGDSFLETQPDHLPDRYEAGTPNVAGIVGLGAAVEFILDQTVETIHAREMELVRLLLERLQDIPGNTVYGPGAGDPRTGVVSFNLRGLSPDRVAQALDQEYGILVRGGLHCAPLAHATIGTSSTGTVRVSVGCFTQPQEIEFLPRCLEDLSRRRDAICSSTP